MPATTERSSLSIRGAGPRQRLAAGADPLPDGRDDDRPQRLLSAVVSPWFLLLTGFVAANQLAFVAFGNCPSSWVLRRYFGVKAACDR